MAGPYVFKLAEQTVELTGGEDTEGNPVTLTITCRRATYEQEIVRTQLEMEGALANKAALAQLGKKDEAELEPAQRRVFFFRARLYPKLAACSKGDWIPGMDEAFTLLPSTELNKWYVAAATVNPTWFDAFRELSEKALKAIADLPADDPQYVELKKNEEKPGT